MPHAVQAPEAMPNRSSFGISSDAVAFLVVDGQVSISVWMKSGMPAGRLLIQTALCTCDVSMVNPKVSACQSAARTGSIDRLSGSARLRDAVELGTIDELIAAWERESRDFQQKTAAYLIYSNR